MISAIKLMIIIGILEGLSSALGGFFSGIIKINSNNVIASLYEISAGMMTSIVCFDMLPESFKISNIYFSVFWVIIGVIIILTINNFSKKINKNTNNKKINMSIKTFILVLIMTAHNITEGIAVGASLDYSRALGLSILISIFLHNIPEGMVVGISMKLDGKSLFENIKYCILVGMPTGIGAFIGNLIGSISDKFIALSLSLSGGAMLYIVACDLIPSSQALSKEKKVYIMYIIGLILGIFATNIY